MSRHAYLIMAHNHFEQLRALLRCLDDGRNVIYLHLDAKLGTVDVGPVSYTHLTLPTNSRV